eukprot:COSAG05_NODE_2275_length_3297_cov_87.259225_4_plen_55_part_00
MVFRSLTSLDLSWNCIRAKGATAIGAGLAFNTTMRQARKSFHKHPYAQCMEPDI